MQQEKKKLLRVGVRGRRNGPGEFVASVIERRSSFGRAWRQLYRQMSRFETGYDFAGG